MGVFFGGLSILLEMWGESEFHNTTTEYVYDTRPGMTLVAFDLFFLWAYVSRSFKTFQSETRIKQRTFYRQYGFAFALWFASLPAVAALARVLASWVRFRITFVISALAHALSLGLLIYTFRPSVATRLYELTTTEYQPVCCDEELDRMLG